MVSWWYSKANKIWLRIMALVVSSVFFFTQVAGASVPDGSFWRERRKSRQKLFASREKPQQSDSWSGEAGLRVKKLEEKDVAGEVSSLITPHNLFTVPSQYGTVKEVHTQATSKKPQGIGNRLIIHIQDAHSSPEAQLNSANILKYLQKGVAGESTLPLLICVEGSSGLVDTTLLSTFPEKKIKEKVASEFLKEGKITGEEYFAIIQNEEGKAPRQVGVPGVTIYGVENKRAYEKNLKAFDEGLSSGKRLRNYLQKVREEIKPLKARLYNKRLKDLESKIEAYQKKKISLTEYCQYLYRLSYEDVVVPMNRDDSSTKKSKVHALPLQNSSDVGTALLGRSGRQSDRPALSGLNTGATKGARGKIQSPFPASAKYPNFGLFVEASKFEEKIDFSKVDSERSKYIKELSEKLTNDELSDLLIMSLDYRLGKVTSAEYYTYLQSLSSRIGKGVRSQDPRILTELVTSKEGKNEYPNLNLYIRYNKLYDRIDQNRLFSEISELEEEVKEKLCEREEERKLVRLSRMLGVLQDLTSLKISNEDLAYYHKHHNEITPGIFSNFITAHKLGVDTLANQGGRSKGDMAQERNSAKAVVSGPTGLRPNVGLLRSLSLRPATLSKFEEFYRIALNRNEALVDNTISRMEKEGVKVAVLIAGGFHTPGITELLRSRNISYVVVTPRLGESHTSDIEISPRKKRTDFEKAIAGIIGALRAATQLGDLPVKTNLIVHVKGTSKIFKPTELFEELMKKWEAGIAGRPELRRVIDSVELSPVVLTRRREGKAFAIGFARGTNGRTLPFVFQCDLDGGSISKVISGKDNCKNFLLSSSFDNAKLTQRDIMAALGLAEPKDGEKVTPDLALVSEHIPAPESADSKRVVSTERSAPKVLRLPVAFSERILSNAAFGNIGWWWHRSRGGLNDLIKNLFDQRQDVTGAEEFAGEKSARVIEGKVREILANLDYDDLSFVDKIISILIKILTLGRSGILNKKEFDRKKEDLQNFSIHYLDSGRNLFWVNLLRIRIFGRIFDLLPEGLKNFLSRLVPWRYAAAHYGVGKTRSYVSAGFARRASPGQLLEVNSHEGLHILGLSHRQALKIARKKSISYGAKELMDRLAEEDKKEEARTPLVDFMYGFLETLALSIFSYINLHPVPSFEKVAATLLRGRDGRFIHHPGKRPEEAKVVIALSNLWEKGWFTLQEYGQAYEEVGPTLAYEPLAKNWEETARGDLQELEKAGFLTIDKKETPHKYRVTEEGKAECLGIRASLLDEDMTVPLSRAWIPREAQSNPSPNRKRLLERLNAFIDSEIPLEYKRADLRRRLREERAKGIEFDISGKCSVPIVKHGMKYWIDEYFLGVDLLELVPDHKNYARVDILREEIVHKLAHSRGDMERKAKKESIDTGTLEGLKELFMEETWATMGELEVEIEVGDEGREAMLAEFEEWAKSHGVDLNSKIGWQTIELAGPIASRPDWWTRRGGFTVAGINHVGAMLLNVFQEFDDLKTKLTTRGDLYAKIYAEREERRIKELFNKRRGDLITFLSRISGLNRRNVEKEMDAYTGLERDSIHHIYETFIEKKVAIVDQGDLFKGLDVTTSLKLLNLLSLYARCEKAELIQIKKGRSDVAYVRNCISKLDESQVLATSIKQVQTDTIKALSELATTHEKVVITNSVNVNYKNATSEGIETGGLTPEDLEVQASLMDSEAVTKRLRNSIVKGFLSWVRNVSARIPQIETVADDLRGYKDIIFLGAPAMAEAIIHSQGIKIEGRRIHFVNNFEGTRFQAMERLPDFSWDDTYVVVVSQGAGDSIQKENLEFLKKKVGTKITVLANFRNPLLKEAPEEHRLNTTDIKDNEGVVSFSGVALALAMSLAGLDYKEFVKRVEEVIKDNIESSVGLAGSAAGKFASIIRGLGLKKNHKGELVKTIMMLSYDKAAQYVINAATLSSNQRLAGLRTYFGSHAPEVNHHDFQIAMGRNGTLMVLISPDKWPTSQVIPPSAKSRWASTPESQYNTDDFMNISKKGIQTELTEFSDHNIGITYKPDLEGLADLVGLIQLASEIDYAVSLECGEIKGKEHNQAPAVVREFDRDFRKALITKSTKRPSSEITMSDDMTTIDISGLMGEKESLLRKDEIPDALVAAAKNKLTAQRSHHIGGQHIHLDEPHQAATKDEIEKSLDLISLAAENKKNFIVVGVGGPHNDPKFGVQPLRGFYADERTGKKVLFGGYTLDPTLMKELIDAVDKDPDGTMIMYISSSGETAEPDNTYHILLEHLMKKSKELNLDESAAKQRLVKEAERIGKDPDTFIAEMEGFAQRQGLTLAQYEFVRDHILIITGRRGYLNFEAQARGFRRPMHPLSSGRHAIYTLTLYMMKALGMNTDAFIKGGQEYVKDMFLTSGLLSAGEKKKLQKNAKEIETKSGAVQDELMKLAVKDINKALERERKMESGCGVIPPDHGISNMLNKEGELEVSSLEDFRKVVDILTDEKWEVEKVESLLKEKALSGLKAFLQRDPGFLAGALMGYIGRHKGRFRIKFVDLTQLLGRAGKWRDKHRFNEGANKPHISTIAESMETQDILNLLPALADDKESIVVLCEDTNPEDPLKAQKLALSETVRSFLRDHGIPFVVLGSRFNERAHATHILAMMQLNLGYGCTIADPPHGYSPDLQVYGQEKCGKARVAVDVAADKDRGKEPTGIDDVIEQFTLDEELISIVKTSMTMGQRFFDIIKGKDIIKFWSRPNHQADELVKAASDGVMKALESENILRGSVHSIITIHPITKAPKIERDLNKDGKYVVWIIPCDNLIEGFNPLSPGGNPGSMIVISEVDQPGKPISQQSLNLDNTRMIIEFIHGPSDEPGVMVWGRREMFGHTETAVYSYIKVGDILIPRILKAGSHFTSVPEKRGTDAFNICDTQADLPPTVAKIWNKARDTEVRSRDFRSPVANIAKTANGGISEFTTNLLEALIHSIFAQGMEANTIIVDKDGNFYDGEKLYDKGIKIADIDNLKAFRKVMFTTGDPEWMDDLKKALEEAKKTGNKDDNKPRRLPDPIWVPDGSLLINRPKLTDFLREKGFDEDLIRLVDLWTRVSVEFGQEYKKTSTLKPMGTANIAGEVQYVADIIADKRYHDKVFKALKNLLFISISEERRVTLYSEDGKIISFCDPVDGVKNLPPGLVTGNIEATTEKDGSGGVSMHFLQGSNILIFEDGEETHCTIWDGNDFRVMYKYEFGEPVPWAIKNIAVGGADAQYGATNPDARTLVDRLVTQEGYYSDNATGMLIDIARILERSLSRTFDRKLRPRGENLGVYDIVPLGETVVGGHLKSGGFLYLPMATARSNPEIVDLGAKMRLTELVALCKEMDRVEGLGYHFGTNKSLRRIIIAHHDENLPKLAYPCFLGVDDDVLKEINRFMWRRYVEQGFASKMQAETPFEKYDVANDPDYQVASDIDPKDRVFRLSANPVVGIVRFEGEGCYPVHGRLKDEKGKILLDVNAIFPAQTSEKKPTAHEGKRPKDKDDGRYTGTAPTPLLLVKNILLGTLTAVGLGGVIFLLQQFAPHLLPAFLQVEFSFFKILAGVLGGIIPVVFLHELGHWLVIGLTDSLKVGHFVWPRIVFRDGKGRLMIGIGRRDSSPLTTVQSLAGPLTGLVAILFAFFSPFSLPVALGITLTLLSINLSSFFWGDFEITHRETVVTKFKQGKIKNIQRNKVGYVAIQNTSGWVWLFDPQENIVFEKLDGFKGLQLTENYLATCNTDNLLTLRNIKTKEVIFENVNASFGFEISEDETLLSTWDSTGRLTIRDINTRSIFTGRFTKKPGKNPSLVEKARENLSGKNDVLMRVYSNRQKLGRAEAMEVAKELRRLIKEKGKAVMVLAAAPSQDEFLDELAKRKGIDWSKVVFFPLDDYIDLPEEHKNTFKYYLNERFFNKLRKLGVEPNVHFIKDLTGTPEEICEKYSQLIQEEGGIDIACIGIGENGHIAYDDPGSLFFTDRLVEVAIMDERCRKQQLRDYENHPDPERRYKSLDDVPRKAFTLTIPAILSAGKVFCSVPADSKKFAVRSTIFGPVTHACPASLLKRHKYARFYFDRDSASLLGKEFRGDRTYTYRIPAQPKPGDIDITERVRTVPLLRDQKVAIIYLEGEPTGPYIGLIEKLRKQVNEIKVFYIEDSLENLDSVLEELEGFNPQLVLVPHKRDARDEVKRLYEEVEFKVQSLADKNNSKKTLLAYDTMGSTLNYNLIYILTENAYNKKMVAANEPQSQLKRCRFDIAAEATMVANMAKLRSLGLLPRELEDELFAELYKITSFINGKEKRPEGRFLFALDRPGAGLGSLDIRDGQVETLLTHPDDEMSWGGILSELAVRGCNVEPIYLTTGHRAVMLDKRGRPIKNKKRKIKIRNQEARKSIKRLGIKTKPCFLALSFYENIDENNEPIISPEDREKLYKKIESDYYSFRKGGGIGPFVIITNQRIDHHRDHRAAYDIGTWAARRLSREQNAKIAVIYGPSVWADDFNLFNYLPDDIVDEKLDLTLDPNAKKANLFSGLSNAIVARELASKAGFGSTLIEPEHLGGSIAERFDMVEISPHSEPHRDKNVSILVEEPSPLDIEQMKIRVKEGSATINLPNGTSISIEPTDSVQEVARKFNEKLRFAYGISANPKYMNAIELSYYEHERKTIILVPIPNEKEVKDAFEKLLQHPENRGDEFAQTPPSEGINVDEMIEGLKSGDPDVRLETVKKIMSLYPELREKVLGHFASLPLSGKTIFDTAKKIGSPVPAWNIDNGVLSRLQIEPLMRAALDNDALVIFEVGATGAMQTYPPKGPQLPQYCAEVAKMLYEKTKKVVTYPAHLDHLQIPEKDYKKNPEAAIQKAVDCVIKWIRDGGTSAAVDTSTLTNTDVKREDFDSDEEYLFARLKDVIKTASIILTKIYEVTNELGIDIGIEGEVGDVGKELSTLKEAMYYYVEIREKLIAVGKKIGIDFSKVPWMDVIAIQAGTAHGYDIDENDRLVPYAGGEISVEEYEKEEKKGYVFERIAEIVKGFWQILKIMIAIALHGFSGTPIAVAKKLVGKGVAKTNINTDLQSITWKVLQAYNPKLYKHCYDLARDAAIKELEKSKKKEEQEEYQKEKEKLQKKIGDLQIVTSLRFEKSKNRIIYGKWGAPGLRKLFRASEEKPQGWEFLDEIMRALRDDKTVRMRLIEDMTDQELREYGLDDLIDKQAKKEYLEQCFYKLELACVPAKLGDPKGLTALEAIHKLTYDRGSTRTKAFKLQSSALKVRPVNRLRELRLQQWQLDDIRAALEQVRSRTSEKEKKPPTGTGKNPKDAKKIIATDDIEGDEKYFSDLVRAFDKGEVKLKNDVFLLSGMRQLIEPMIERATTGTDNKIRARAIGALAEIGCDDERVIRVLEQGKASDDSVIRDSSERASETLKDAISVIKGIEQETGEKVNNTPHRYLELEDINLVTFVDLYLSYPVPLASDIERIVCAAEQVHGSEAGLPTILEVGAAKGLLAYLLAKTGRVKVIALDFDPLVRFCRFQHPNLTFKAENMKEYKGKVDLALCSWMTEGVNLTPAIRDIDAPCIVYVKDVPWERTGFTLSMRRKMEEDRDEDLSEMELSYEPGENYRQAFNWLGFSIWGFGSDEGIRESAEYLVQVRRDVDMRGLDLSKITARKMYPYELGLRKLMRKPGEDSPKKYTLRSLVLFIATVILCWPSTGLAKDIVKNIPIEVPEVLGQLGKGTTAEVIYPILAALGIGFLVGVLVGMVFDVFERRAVAEGKYSIKWPILAIIVGNAVLVVLPGSWTLVGLAGLLFGYSFGGLIMYLIHRHRLKEKQVFDAIVVEFWADELEHIIQQIEKPTFIGEVRRQNAPILYDLLERLKSILDEKGVRNNLPENFQRKRQIGGLLMLKEALSMGTLIETGKSRDEQGKSEPKGNKDQKNAQKRPVKRILSLLLGGLIISLFMTRDWSKSVGEITVNGQHPGWGRFILLCVLLFSLPFLIVSIIKRALNWWAKRGEVYFEKTTSKKTDAKHSDESKKRPSRRFRSILLVGLGILLLINSNVFGAVGEIMKSGQQAGLGSSFGFPFGLGLWGGVLAFAIAVVGVRAVYREVSLAGTGIVEVERVRLPQVLGLEAVWQALVPLLEGGQRAVAAIFRQPSKRTDVAMKRWNFPQNELSTQEIARMEGLINWVKKGAVKRLWREGRPYWWSPEANLLRWSLPTGEAEALGEIGRLAETVRELGYDKVLVIGEAKPFAKVAAAIPKKEGYPEVLVLESSNQGALSKFDREIHLEKTLFVVSSPAPGQGYEAYEYFYNELTKFYEGQGISSKEITSRVGRQFVGIVGEGNAPLAEEAMKKKFRMIFTEEMGNPYSIFSYSGLVPLASAGVDIVKFVESGEQGRAMCGREKLEENPGVQLAVSLKKMMEAGQEIVMVLPEELGGFGELLQKQISRLWGESKKVILVAEEEFSGLQSYGQDTGFIGIKVGAKESLAIRELKKAGHPVFELPGKEAMGELFYIAEFGTAFSYLLGIEGFRKPGSVETSLLAEAVVGHGLEEMSLAGAIGTEIAESKALLKHLVGRKGFKHGSTEVFVLDITSALEIETVSNATAREMNIEFKVRSNGELFEFMREIVEAAKQAGNPNGVRFAFASNIKNLRKEVIERMLRNSMVKNGLTPDVVGSIVNEGWIIDRETGGIVDPSGRISAERVCSFITEKLLGNTEGNGIDFNIITTDVDAWKKAIDSRMVKKVLWMVLEPAKEGQALATPESLIVAIEGKAKASRWLKEFIRLRYAADPEGAERVISQIEDGKGNIVLPARRVDNREIEAEWDVYKCQA